MDWDMDANTVGSELNARDPTVVTLEWGGQGYQGLQYSIQLDVPVIATPDYSDDVMTTLQNWTASTFPNWQQNPATWRPSDANPAIYWHYVTLAGPLENDWLTFDYAWQGAVVAARIVTPSRIARTMATTRLSQALGRSMQDYMLMPDGTWLQYAGIKAEPQVMAGAEGQLQMNVKWILDTTVPDDDWSTGPPIDPAILTWAEDESEGGGEGPTIEVGSKGITHTPGPT
jgi:hypothetical protein